MFYFRTLSNIKTCMIHDVKILAQDLSRELKFILNESGSAKPVISLVSLASELLNILKLI